MGKSDFIEGRCMSELTLKKKEKTYTEREVSEILRNVILSMNSIQLVSDSGIKIDAFQNFEGDGITARFEKSGKVQWAKFMCNLS